MSVQRQINFIKRFFISILFQKKNKRDKIQNTLFTKRK